ncbi:HlyD family efflux transporter periplasmic adaptor subunit [Lachnospiraceae bacterium 66-29]
MERKKIFGIFGGFLAVMLVFTILSRAVSGASMAKVETVKISSGMIEHKVSGSGKVEAGKEIAVYTENGQRVKEICVQEGQSVEEGDTLFRVEMEDLEEQILAAQQELEKMKLQNQDAKSAHSVEAQNRANAKNRASEDYHQAVTEGDSTVAETKAAWDQAEAALQNFLAAGPPAPTPAPAPESSPEEPGQTGDDQKPQSEQESQVENSNEAGGGSKLQSEERDKKEQELKLTDPQSEQIDKKEEQPKAAETNSETETDPKAEWEAQKAALEQAVAEARSAYETAVSARAERVKSAARALEDASMQPATDSTARQGEISRQQQELTLNKLLALKEAEGKITAPVRGMVTQIAITTGDFTTNGTAIRIADTSEGSRLVATIDKSDQKYVSKGSPVNISASGSKGKITDYTVSNVSENEQDNTLLDVSIELPEGVLEAGTSAEIEIVQKSKNYNTVLPVQALHEEQNVYYVFIVQEEQGVMGTELVVKRYEVEVLDKNSTNAALAEGMLTGDQDIVKSSSRVIEDGSRVRKM